MSTEKQLKPLNHQEQSQQAEQQRTADVYPEAVSLEPVEYARQRHGRYKHIEPFLEFLDSLGVKVIQHQAGGRRYVAAAVVDALIAEERRQADEQLAAMKKALAARK